MSIPAGHWKRAHQVNVDMGKTVRRDRNRRRWWLGVYCSLGPLTGNALASPLINLLRHAGPDKTGGDEATCSPYTRMPGIVQPVENAAAQRQWHQWSEEGGGHITKQVFHPNQPTDNIKAGRLPHEPDLTTSALSGGKGGQVRNSGDEGPRGGQGFSSCRCR
jgi:hypothetical protein